MKAVEYLRDLLGDVSGLSIEEVELKDDGTRWFITLGFLDSTQLAFMTGKKTYKQFEIDATTGEVYAMRMRSA